MLQLLAGFAAGPLAAMAYPYLRDASAELINGNQPRDANGKICQWEYNGNTVHEDMYVTNLIFRGLFKMGDHGISSHRVSFSKNLDLIINILSIGDQPSY